MPPAIGAPGPDGAVLDDNEVMDVKRRIDALSAAGERREATRLARSLGAVCPGDRMPYGSGYVTVYDGHSLETGFSDGYRIVRCAVFQPDRTPVSAPHKAPAVRPGPDGRTVNIVGLAREVERRAAMGDRAGADRLAAAMGAWTVSDPIPDEALEEGAAVTVFDGRRMETGIVADGRIVSAGAFWPETCRPPTRCDTPTRADAS
ncbi:hypothetical protein D2E22_0314 [Bifidobacterium castoris]|uniref:Uncharacterized protein n=2 Tax=Bifidobacterium castoris TaxID=2306972 RepID=A0A430FAJ9_9BIFI|nr:hypothetical protein D2E22_0314 [Bifidobacterium castoris]